MKGKILQVCAVDFTAKNLLLELMGALKNDGFEVSLTCKKGKYYNIFVNNGIKFYDISVARGYNPIKHLISIFKLVKLIRKERFDVVHSHTTAASLDGCIAAKLAGVPIVLYTIHGFGFTENYPYILKEFYILVERLKCKLSTLIFTQSEEDRSTAIKEGITVQDKILTISNGIDLAKFSKKHTKISKSKIYDEFGIPDNAILLIIVARLSRIKGYVDLFTAMNQVMQNVPNLYLLIVGGIPEEEPHPLSKEHLISLINNDEFKKRIVFAGARDDVKDILADSDIFVLPSYKEGMPRSIIEAMAMELPVIATNIRGSREEIVDGETGILVPVGDVNALSNAMIKLAKDSELRKTMGKKGREKAEKYFDESKVIEKQIIIIERLLNEKIQV